MPSRSTSPWLTVVVPTHNGATWLGHALQSVVDQDDPGIAVILIDSSDAPDTVAVANSFSGRLNIRVDHRPEIRAWTQKTNCGFAAAQTDYVCILHQDDAWLPDRAAAVRRAIEAHPDAVMHLHASLFIDAQGRTLGRWRCPLPGDGSVVPSDMLMERLMVQNFVAIPSPTIRRDAFLRVGGMEDDLWYTADWDLYLKLAVAGPVTYDDAARACFRVHGASQTISGSRNRADFRAQLLRVLDRHGGILAGRHRDAVLRAALASVAINTALAGANNGRAADLAVALRAFLGLGPMGMWRYLRDSRLLERVKARLKARLAGRLAATPTV